MSFLFSHGDFCQYFNESAHEFNSCDESGDKRCQYCAISKSSMNVVTTRLIDVIQWLFFKM